MRYPQDKNTIMNKIFVYLTYKYNPINTCISTNKITYKIGKLNLPRIIADVKNGIPNWLYQLDLFANQGGLFELIPWYFILMRIIFSTYCTYIIPDNCA